jgi:hypothetical protein
MVIADLTHPEIVPRSSTGEPRMALISDRLVAAVLDFLLFSPLVSLLCAKMMNQIKIQSLLDDSSGRLLASWTVYFSFMLFLIVVLEACSLYLLQATPGQYFLKLRVISYPHPSEKLSLGQALLRASLFTMSGLMMGVPFLEVLGHPLRRALHERASDTIVVTLKTQVETAPLEIERRYIASWISMFFLFISLTVGGILVKSWHVSSDLNRIQTAVDREIEYRCEKIPLTGLSLEKRIDTVLTLFSLGSVHEDCVASEADHLLWEARAYREIAYFAKGILSKGATRKAYFDLVCKSPKSEWCTLSQSMGDDLKKVDVESLRRAGMRSVFSRVLLLRHSEASKNHLSALALIRDLRSEKPLADYLERAYVRNVWQLQDQSRKPASETPDYLLEFKNRYEVP